MSEMGDDFRQMREEQQKKKADRLKWNTDVIYHLAEDLDYEVKQHSEFHLSLFHPKKGRFDIYPSTGKACWFVKRKPGKTFTIPNLEEYILKHFKS